MNDIAVYVRTIWIKRLWCVEAPATRAVFKVGDFTGSALLPPKLLRNFDLSSVSLFTLTQTAHLPIVTFDSYLIKNPGKMAVVRCLILLSKFTKNRLSAGHRPDPLGELIAVPQVPLAGSCGKGGERDMEGREGWQ